MALINRVSRLFKADFHAVLDQIEEPEQVLKQAIRDMEDVLATTEQHISLAAHDQESLSVRTDELNTAIAEIDEQIELCFDSDKDDLAKNLVRKKLEAERLLKHLSSRHTANAKYLASQRTVFEENRATLESLRQKAELFAQRSPAHPDRASKFDDTAWTARELTIGDEEVEVAFLQAQSARRPS